MPLAFVNRVPCAEDVGKLFWLQHRGEKFQSTQIVEIRIDKDGRLFVSGECVTGWEKQSYGNPASLYPLKYTWMAGPIEMPEGVRK